MWELLFSNYWYFLLVFARMSGMIFFNPIFGRKNLPIQVKVGLAFSISLLMAGTLSYRDLSFRGLPDFIFICFKELLIGFIIGFLFQMLMSAILVAGEVMDMQLGVGMSKLYDPHSNISIPVSGSILNLLYMLFFFAGNSHLTYLKIMILSFDIFPVGNQWINPQVGGHVIRLFGSILVLAIKLSLPVIALETITEIGMGVLMRMVPQINVFVVGLQLRLLVGILMIALILPNAAAALDSATEVMFEQMINGLRIMSG